MPNNLQYNPQNKSYMTYMTKQTTEIHVPNLGINHVCALNAFKF